jgi:hypothetical protein
LRWIATGRGMRRSFPSHLLSTSNAGERYYVSPPSTRRYPCGGF